MNSTQFRPGDKVVTLAKHGNLEIGAEGTIHSRWVGTVYAVKAKDGNYHWFFSNELASIDPSRHQIREGDRVRVISNDRQHQKIEKGDLVQVIKLINLADYYGVIIDNELHWLNGFELGHYF